MVSFSTAPGEKTFLSFMKPFFLKNPKLYQNYINELKGPSVINNPNGDASIETYTILMIEKAQVFLLYLEGWIMVTVL